jgi:hypothetical protein
VSIYRGYLYVPEKGNYVFATTSDDASVMKVDGLVAVGHAALRDAGSPGSCLADSSAGLIIQVIIQRSTGISAPPPDCMPPVLVSAASFRGLCA